MNAPHELSPIIDCSRLLSVLQRHIGETSGISAASLARECDISEREARLQITFLRMEGTAICGMPRTGYFIAANADELNEFTDFLKSRALGSLRIISALKRIALPDLLQQLHLPT